MSVVHAAEVNTWPAIPRIRAHCLVETTLEQCVQRLRRRMTAESQRAQLEAMKHATQVSPMKGRDRTPSFYTSKSLVNLSGLSISDPAPIQQAWYQDGRGSKEQLAGTGSRSPRHSTLPSKPCMKNNTVIALLIFF